MKNIVLLLTLVLHLTMPYQRTVTTKTIRNICIYIYHIVSLKFGLHTLLWARNRSPHFFRRKGHSANWMLSHSGSCYVLNGARSTWKCQWKYIEFRSQYCVAYVIACAQFGTYFSLEMVTGEVLEALCCSIPISSPLTLSRTILINTL